MRFSLKRLFGSVAVVAAGAGMIAIPSSRQTVPEYVMILAFWTGIALIGAGLGALYKRPIVGAIVGGVAALALIGSAAFVLFTFYIE